MLIMPVWKIACAASNAITDFHFLYHKSSFSPSSFSLFFFNYY